MVAMLQCAGREARMYTERLWFSSRFLQELSFAYMIIAIVHRAKA